MHKEERQLLEFVSRELVTTGQPRITPVTQLFADRVINSMSVLELIAYLEGRLGRRLKDTEITMPRFRSVRSIVETFFDDHDC